MISPIRHYVWRAETIRRINRLLDVAKSKKKMVTSDFFDLIDSAEILKQVDSKIINIIEEYNFVESNKAFAQLLKFGGDFDKIRKYIGQAKNCNIYRLEDGELKNVDRKLFIEVAEKMVDVLAEEILSLQEQFEEQLKLQE